MWSLYTVRKTHTEPVPVSISMHTMQCNMKCDYQIINFYLTNLLAHNFDHYLWYWGLNGIMEIIRINFRLAFIQKNWNLSKKFIPHWGIVIGGYLNRFWVKKKKKEANRLRPIIQPHLNDHKNDQTLWNGYTLLLNATHHGVKLFQIESGLSS